MLLTDYFRSTPDPAWDIAVSCGVRHGVIRLPEDAEFDLADASHWQRVYDRFIDFGVTPVIIEPMPNAVHDHIKAGDEKRDESIQKVLDMLPIMDHLNIRTICFNWMAHIGWLRTHSDIPERGGAKVTGFDMASFKPIDAHITEEELWQNYEYFLRAVIPAAEKHGIQLALHPDDPPMARLGDVSRIMVNRKNIEKAVTGIVKSENLGVTFCQANFHIMGEDLMELIEAWKEKIFFVHFRNTTGVPTKFRETYHDNGELPMAELLKHYVNCGIDVPIRVDHVPTMAGEVSTLPGYDALGRLFAIGYLKGIMESVEGRKI
ncbi:MAG: mannonate dehydratase [Clostridia bacterium]|nr:mannonate dehydratase [Clostridia bacterium]